MKSEIDDLSKYLKSIGLLEYDVEGDGNCLFRAISHQMYGSDRNHAQLRSKAVEYIKSNPDDFSSFMEESVANYVVRMAKCGVYGGNLELVAISKVLHVNIVIYQGGVSPLVIKCRSAEQTLYLVYYSYEHYASTIKSDSFKTPTFVQEDECNQKTTQIINQIIKISGHDNVEKIKELLLKHDGKFGLVLDDLYELECTKESLTEPNVQVKKSQPSKPLKSRERKKVVKHARKEAALEKKRNKTVKDTSNSLIETAFAGIHI